MVYGINSAYSAQTASKLYVPVNKSSLLYSHFDHVSGVAAKKGQNGISISTTAERMTIPTTNSNRLTSSTSLRTTTAMPTL